VIYYLCLLLLILSIFALPLVYVLGSEVVLFKALMVVVGISVATCLSGYYTDEGR
jgi:hypothetical protein